MKTTFLLKSISFILIAVISGMLTSHVCILNHANILEDKSISCKTFHDPNIKSIMPGEIARVSALDSITRNHYGNSFSSLSVKDTVALDIAAFYYDSFLLWQRLLPKTFELDENTNIITFPKSQQIHSSDTKAIKHFIEMYNSEAIANNATEQVCFDKIPLTTNYSLSRSYFIPFSDIETIRKHLTCNDTIPKNSGIRVYMATTPLTFNNSASTASHFYITPALDNLHDSYLNVGEKEFVLDLTTPCPHACPIDSKIDRYRYH